jgi:hypothetical protein
MLYIEEFEYRSEANRFDSDFVFKKTKKSELSFFLKTKGKKRKGSLVNYRSFAITSPHTSSMSCICMCLDNRSLSCSRTCLHYKSLSLVVSKTGAIAAPGGVYTTGSWAAPECAWTTGVCVAPICVYSTQAWAAPGIVLTTKDFAALGHVYTVLLHYDGFCNNCTLKRCLHI